MKTILIILVVFYGLRFLSKLLAPWMMRKAQSKIQRMAEEKMRQQGFGAQGQSQRPEGSVTVENVKPKKPSKSIKGSDDDYIDYEVVE